MDGLRGCIESMCGHGNLCSGCEELPMQAFRCVAFSLVRNNAVRPTSALTHRTQKWMPLLGSDRMHSFQMRASSMRGKPDPPFRAVL
jgi:hypothetical protein